METARRGGSGQRGWLAVVVAVFVGATACSAGAPLVGEGPTIAEADDQQATCKVAKDPLNPLIVEWPGTSKVDLDTASQRGVVVVSYAGCVLKILPTCTAGGGYEFHGVTPVREKIVIENESELYARLPLGVASLKGELAAASRLELEYVAIGQRLSSGPPATLSGDCAGATHYVRAIMVGAYGLDAMGKASVGAAATVGEVGAGAEHGERARRLRGSGEVQQCASGAVSGDVGKMACNAILQLGLAPLPGGAPGGATGATNAGMVRIPAGKFFMGADDGEPNEKPVHPTSVESFELDVTEVTVAEYSKCVRAGACPPAPTTTWWKGMTADEDTQFTPWCNGDRPDRQKHPINCVDWNHATNYCKWVGKRLPTEEEWELAARGTDGRRFPWGSDEPGGQLCWQRWSPPAGTCEVGAFVAGKNAFGLLDMAGNVWEFTSSGISDDYASPRRNTAYIHRGGAWSWHDAKGVRASMRDASAPASRASSIGFRCAR